MEFTSARAFRTHQIRGLMNLNDSTEKSAANATNTKTVLLRKLFRVLASFRKKILANKQFIKEKVNIIPPLQNQQTNKKVINNNDKAEIIGKCFVGGHHTTHDWKQQDTEYVVRISLRTLNESMPQPTAMRTLLASTQEINTLVRLLKNKKSPGKDNINNIVLKHLPRNSIVIITQIINACLTITYYPKMWKAAKVIGIPKPNKDHSLPQKLSAH